MRFFDVLAGWFSSPIPWPTLADKEQLKEIQRQIAQDGYAIATKEAAERWEKRMKEMG